MNIAVLSDIHGNYEAFLSVFKEMQKNNVEKVFVLGDIVGYYYEPEKVLRCLSESFGKNFYFIKGNHERLLSEIIHKTVEAERLNRKYGSGLEIAVNKLNREEIKFLFDSHEQFAGVVDNIKIQLFHGSPFRSDEYLYPDSDVQLLEKCCGNDADYLFIGHTHYPFVFNYNKTSLINVGSVGQARDFGGFSSWALLNTENRVLRMMKTPYDVAPLIEQIKKNNPENNYLINVLMRGK